MSYKIEKVCTTIIDTIDIIIDKCPKNAILVESGTYLGNTAAFIVSKLVENNKDFVLYTIDNFLYENISEEHKNLDNPKGFDGYVSNIKELEVDKYINTVHGDTLKASRLFADESVYCLFVDDNHHYHHVKQQLNSWIPKIMSGGLIIGDDYVMGVKRAYEEVFGDEVKPTERGGCIIYK